MNDSRGHGAGDQLLRDVAAALRDQLRDYDVVVRHGGDEFVCALPGMDMDEAHTRIQLVRPADDSLNPWTVSAGIAVLEDDDSLDSLISRADKALYARRSDARAAQVGVEESGPAL